MAAGRPRIVFLSDNLGWAEVGCYEGRVGAWAAANNVEIAYTPTNSPG